MVIHTRFDCYQKVFYLEKKRIIESEVVSIESKVFLAGGPILRTKYKLLYAVEKDEDEIYSSREELVNDYYKLFS